MDDILSNLNSALDGINVPRAAKPAVQHADSGFDMNAQRCALCFDTIKGKVIKGINRTWHPHCYYWYALCPQYRERRERV